MIDTITVDDINWDTVRESLLDDISGIRPAEYDEVCDTIEETHDVGALASGGLVETAESEGILTQKNGGYTFNVDCSDEEDEDKNTSEKVEPVDPSEVNLDAVSASETHYPGYMTTREQWVCWAGNKQPRAPWRGHVYPVLWSGSLDESERPTVTFEKASKWVEMAGEMNLDYPDDIGPADISHGYLLPHEDSILVLIDLDDVRNPETGEIHPVALEIVKHAGSYAEISQSGEGIHIFISGSLPAGVGKIIEPIDDEPFVGDDIPKVEVYDHSRVVAMTGQHVDGTPYEVAVNQPVIDGIVDEYLDYEEPETSVDELIEEKIGNEDASSGGEQSSYYNFDPRTLAGGEGWEKKPNRIRGPHPVHGSSNNDNCDITDDGKWFCFRHDVGGGGLQLLAVVEGFLDCVDAGEGGLDLLDDEEFLKLCLIARDDYGQSGKPPYRAILAVAKKLYLISENDDTLGGMYEVAREAFDSMELDDL